MAETIDAHHHLWRYSAEVYSWIGPGMEVLKRDFLHEEFGREMRLAGVDGAVAVQARQSVEETNWLLELAKSSATIRGIVGWLPIAEGDIPGALDKLNSTRKLKGLRHVIQDEPDNGFILREDFNAGIRSMSGTSLVYDILIHERHLPQTIEFVRLHPRQAFVLDHLAKPKIAAREIEPWRTNLSKLAETENVACKLSGVITEAEWATWTLEDVRPYLDIAFEAFGSKRLMVGSDWPVCLLASGYSRWWETVRAWCKHFSEAEQAEMLGETAKRIYKLD